MGSDITVIVLAYNEEIHIQRCLENILPVAKEVFVVDCFSTDQTKAIASHWTSVNTSGCSVHFVEHVWPGNQAEQLNWALNNLPIKTAWVLRLDADEYLTEALINEIREKLEKLEDDVTGVVFKRRHIFLGRWIKRGTYPVKLLRLFKYKKAICEQRMMDEHIQLLEGRSVELEYDFVDHNLNNLSWWTQKHVGYALREAVELLNIEYRLLEGEKDGQKDVVDEQARVKQAKKMKYARMPLFWRSFAYFCIRYFVKGGFLEGKEGFLWHFLQGLWYRTLVDAKILEIKEKAKSYKLKNKDGELGKDEMKDGILRTLREEYGMKV
jgi:glycosyltransferase involved in cell wall biosynthesis